MASSTHLDIGSFEKCGYNSAAGCLKKGWTVDSRVKICCVHLQYYHDLLRAISAYCGLSPCAMTRFYIGAKPWELYGQLSKICSPSFMGHNMCVSVERASWVSHGFSYDSSGTSRDIEGPLGTSAQGSSKDLKGPLETSRVKEGPQGTSSVF